MEYIYAALLLHKLGHQVSEENLKKVIHATGSQVDDAKVKTLIASLKGVDIGKELESASIVTAQTAIVETKKEEKKEEEKPVESAAGLAALFG